MAMSARSRRVLRGSAVALFVYVGLVALGWTGFANTPTGFVPQQDKQYLVAFAQLPDAATPRPHRRRDQEDVGTSPSNIRACSTPWRFPGLSINGFTNSPNSGIVFVSLKPFEERQAIPAMSAGAIAGALNGQFAGDPGCVHRDLPAAPGAGPGHDRRLPRADRGSRPAGLRGAL